MSEKDRTLPSGHTYEAISGSEYESQSKDFLAYKPGMIRLSPGGWFLPITFPKYAEGIYNFKFRPTDVIQMGCPKTGTTWLQEILWIIRNSPDLDHPLTDLPAMMKCPLIDLDMVLSNETLEEPSKDDPMIEHFQNLCPGRDIKDGLFLQLGENAPDPRILRTHLTFSFYKENFLEKAKVVYIARNPKDTVVSYLHHSRLLKCHGYVGTTDQFVQYFVDDAILYGPYGQHIREAWPNRNHPNMHFMFYEDLKKDPAGEIRRLAQFMNVNLSDKQVENVVKHTSFENMRKKDIFYGKKEIPESGLEARFDKEVMRRDGGFIRKGQTGTWKETLSALNESKIDAWTKTNFQGLELEFKYT